MESTTKYKRGYYNPSIDRTMFTNIEGFEGLYMINKEGVVLSCSRLCGTVFKKDRILKPLKKSNGYLQVRLHKNGREKKYYLHRLVAQTFIPNPDNLPQVNHKDYDKTNNCVSNLEWCDNSYNVKYSGIPNKLQDILGVKIIIKDLVLNTSKSYNSIKEASKDTKLCRQTIAASLKKNKLVKNGRYKVLYFKCPRGHANGQRPD